MGGIVNSGTRPGLALLVGGTAVIGVAYGAAIALGGVPVWAPGVLALGAAATSVGLFALGAQSRGSMSRGVVALLAALFVVLLASFGTALALPTESGASGRLFLGLPFRLAIVFYGVGFVPLFVLPIAFAKTFERPRAERASLRTSLPPSPLPSPLPSPSEPVERGTGDGA